MNNILGTKDDKYYESLDSPRYSRSSSDYESCQSSWSEISELQIDISVFKKTTELNSVAGLLSLGKKLEHQMIQKEISRASTLRQESHNSLKEEEFRLENEILQDRMNQFQCQIAALKKKNEQLEKELHCEKMEKCKVIDTHEALKGRINTFKQKVKEEFCPRKERDQYFDRCTKLEKELRDERGKNVNLRNQSISIENTNKQVFDRNMFLEKELKQLQNLVEKEYCLVSAVEAAEKNHKLVVKDLEKKNHLQSLKMKQNSENSEQMIKKLEFNHRKQLIELSEKMNLLKNEAEQQHSISLQSFSSQIESLKNQNSALEEKIEMYTKELQVVTRTKNEAVAQSNAIQMELFATKSNEHKVLDYLAKAVDKVGEMYLRVSAMDLRSKKLSNTLLKVSTRVHNAENAFRRIFKKHEVMVFTQQAPLAQLFEAQTQLRKELDLIQLLASTQITTIQRVLKDQFLSSMNWFQARITELQKILESRAAEISELNSLVSTLESSKRQYAVENEMRIEQLTNNLTALKKKEATLSDFIFELQKQMSTLKIQRAQTPTRVVAPRDSLEQTEFLASALSTFPLHKISTHYERSENCILDLQKRLIASILQIKEANISNNSSCKNGLDCQKIVSKAVAELAVLRGTIGLNPQHPQYHMPLKDFWNTIKIKFHSATPKISGTDKNHDMFYLRKKLIGLLCFLESFYGVAIQNSDIDFRIRCIYQEVLRSTERIRGYH